MLKFRWETEFKETENGEIPKDWEIRKLGEVVCIKQGKNISTLKLKDWGYPVFGANGLIGYTDTYHYEEPQVLIACRGSTCGIINWSFPKSFVNNNAMTLLPKSIDKKFLYFSMQLNFISGRIDETITGTGQPQITKETLEPFLIFYPPLSEQSRIATVLSWFDDLIENKKRQNEILEKTAMAIFKSWFIDFEPFRACPEQERGNCEFVYNEELGKEIPKGWEVSPIEKEFYLITGRKYELFDDYFEDCSPYLLIETFKTGKIEFWTIEKEPQVEENDVVLVADGESSGKVLRYQKGILGSTLLTLKPKRENSIELKHLIYLTLKFYEDEIMSHRTGSAIPHLDKDFLKSFLILLPPPHILQTFHSLVEPLFQKIILNQKQIMTIREIRDTLLPLLVFGKLRIEEV
jgi:type I restriction enzyme S subunit